MAEEGSESTRNEESSEVVEDQLPSLESDPHSENEDKGTHLRFLLSNAEAGSIIGKGGATINDIQSQAGSRIQLSRNYEYFPGTTDRIILLSGTICGILKAVDLILSKLLDEFYSEDGGQVDPVSKIRLIVPNSSCGGIIGRAGAVIRSIMEDSRADIKISPQDVYSPGLRDRLVTVTGTLGEQLRGIELILQKLTNDQYYLQLVHVPFPYAARGYNGMNYGSNGFATKYPSNRLHHKEDRISSVTIGVPDENIGLLVGRGGRNIMEISQVSGARIKISDRGDFISGTSNRKVTITGSQRAIRVAESIITRKVVSIGEVGTVAIVDKTSGEDSLITSN